MRQPGIDMWADRGQDPSMGEKSNVLVAFGRRLSELRKARGLTMEEVGAWFEGKPEGRRKRVWAWENGTGDLKATILEELARRFGTSPDYLLTGRDRWPFAAELLDQISQLDDRQKIKLEGAIEMWLQQNAVSEKRDLDQAA